MQGLFRCLALYGKLGFVFILFIKIFITVFK